jgi:hypothetical protein
MLTARMRFTPQQKAELWERWRSGQCIADIARALERPNKSGVYRVLALSGGIAPVARRRALRAVAARGARGDLARGSRGSINTRHGGKPGASGLVKVSPRAIESSAESNSIARGGQR